MIHYLVYYQQYAQITTKKYYTKESFIEQNKKYFV